MCINIWIHCSHLSSKYLSALVVGWWIFSVIWLYGNHYHHYAGVAIRVYSSISHPFKCSDLFARMPYSECHERVIWYDSIVKYIDHKMICRFFFSHLHFGVFIVVIVDVPFNSSILSFQPSKFDCVNKCAWCAFVCTAQFICFSLTLCVI